MATKARRISYTLEREPCLHLDIGDLVSIALQKQEIRQLKKYLDAVTEASHDYTKCLTEIKKEIKSLHAGDRKNEEGQKKKIESKIEECSTQELFLSGPKGAKLVILMKYIMLMERRFPLI